MARALAERFPDFVPGPGWREVTEVYPVEASPEYLALIQKADPSDPVFRQVAPSPEELDEGGSDDPADETSSLNAPRLIHRYSDRALLLVSSECFVRCRHCMRKRLWREGFRVDAETVASWRSYLEDHLEVREVILSGGDPLTLSDRELESLLEAVGRAGAVETVRIHSRAVAAAPSRLGARLARLLDEGGVRRLVTQFNHPAELSPAAARAAAALAGAGIEALNQSVLLRGVNDQARTLAELWRGLVAMGVTPYYLHHPDPARGAMHFRVEMERGLSIYREAASRLPAGMAPSYVVDVPGSAKVEVSRLLEDRSSRAARPGALIPLSP